MISRRSFLAGLGIGAGGLLIEGGGRAWAASSASRTELSPSVFVHVALDGAVTIICHRSEMGQGVRSTLPAIIADELGADLSKIHIIQADGDTMFGDQNTDGSSSVRKRFDDLRVAGARARMRLERVAAQRWTVAPDGCVTEGGVVSPPPRRGPSPSQSSSPTTRREEREQAQWALRVLEQEAQAQRVPLRARY